jgi:two-component system, OmpR family, alkaline phosphatase synthesis response regulator PhoP
MENDVQENKKMMILVAEDDMFLSNVYNKKLTKEGFDVCMAANGEEAIALSKEKKPDIILLDLIMPVKDGFQTLKDLKEDPEMKNTKVIIFSNLSQEEDRQKVMEMGAVDYFVKANISFREVINIIKRHLNIA